MFVELTNLLSKYKHLGTSLEFLVRLFTVLILIGHGLCGMKHVTKIRTEKDRLGSNKCVDFLLSLYSSLKEALVPVA